MALPASGAISFNNINVELGLSGTASLSLGASNVRTLFGVPSGAIALSQGYGKSNRVAINLTIAANTNNYNIFSNKGGSYVAGKSDVTLTINSGVQVGSTSTAAYALDTGTGWTAGDTITIVNNGYIFGKGGDGGNGGDLNNGNGGSGLAGGPALIVRYATSINNGSGYIYSGGGGGGGCSAAPAGTWGTWGGGGGGGGAGYGSGGAAGVADGASTAGAAGGLTTPGGGGVMGSGSGNGGSGGGMGAAGSAGPGYSPWVAGSGGGTSNSITGIGSVSWIAGNTRVYGPTG